MNKALIISLIAILGSTLLLALYNNDTNNTGLNKYITYVSYLKRFNKDFPNPSEFMYRFELFNTHLKQMQKHNSDKTKTWKMGINQFSDLTQQEFVEMYLGQKSQDGYMEVVENDNQFNGDIDWRLRNVITPIKNQGKCGSCWAFAATAAHQSYQIQFKDQPRNIVLSEQQLVDCSNIQPYGNNGCDGGLALHGLQYIRDFGQTTNASYPYQMKTQTCKQKRGPFTVTNVQNFTGCDAMEQMLQRRPFAVRVDATNWHKYQSGIFDDCDTKINHAVFMVGVSDDSWLIKNSWSPAWGEKGYIRLKKGNTCAVCYGPSFPI